MSELITPNEFIQSDALIKALKDIAKEIENVLTQMGKATDIVKKHYTEVGKGATTIKELTDNEKKKNETSKIGQDIENAVIKVQEKKYKVLIQNSEAVQKVTKELEEETKAQKKNELAQKASISSNEGLRAKIRILRDEKEKLIHTDKDYQKNLDSINAKINAHQKELDKSNDLNQKRISGIGKYKEQFVEAFTKIVAVIGMAKGAMSLFNKVIENSETLSDKLEETMGGVRSGLSYLGSQLVKLDFSNLIGGMQRAAVAGREYVRVMDDMKDRRIALGFQEATASTRYTEIIMKLKNINTTNEEAQRLAIEAITMQDELSKKKQKIADTELNALLKKIATERGLIKGNSEAEIEIGKKQVLEWAQMSDDLTKDMMGKAETFTKNAKEKTIVFGETLTNMFPTIATSISLISNKVAQESVAATDKAGKSAYDLIKNLGQITEAQKGQILGVFQEIEGIRNEEAAKEGKVANRAAKLLEENRKKEEKNLKDSKDSKENTLKEKEKADKEYFDSEMERLKEEEAAILADLDWKWQKEEAYAKKSQDLLDKKLNAANENRSRLSSFFEEAEHTDFGKTEEFAQRKLKFEEDFNNAKSIEDEKYLTDKYIKEEEAAARNFEIQKEYFAQLSEYKKEIVLSAFDLVMALQDRELSKIEEKKNRELDAAGDNAKKKEQIEKKYAKQIADIKRKQAIAEKAQALFGIGINTAQAIIGFLAHPGGVHGLTLSVLAGVLGVIQAGIVASKPIPQFYKGVKNFEGGLAKVGEKGFELGETKDRGMFLTPDTATDMLLPERTTIYPHEKAVEMMGGMQPAYVDKLIEEQRLTRKLIASRTVKSTTITSSGWKYTTEKLRSSQNHIDKYFRC